MNRYLPSFLGCLMLLFLTACSTEYFDEKQLPDNGQYVYELRLDGGVQDYGDATRATKVWQNGDVIYLRFSTSGSITLGWAIYSSGNWTLATDKALMGSGSCQAVKIDNASSSNISSVTLSPQSVIYEDLSGTWELCSDNVLTVRVGLMPKTARLRFKGTNGTNFSLTGLSTYTSYSINDGTFTQSQSAVSGSITSTGYSDYIYGLMADTSNPTLITNGFTMECSSTMMQAGQSGWLNYPTTSSHTGWTVPDIDNNGHGYVDLGLSVKWATCNVGAENPYDHGDYYAWGETETKTTYDWSTYKWMASGYSDWKHVNKYTYPDNQTSGIWFNNGVFIGDKKTTLEPEDDVAHVKWGGSWRMPTRAEQEELRNAENCDWTMVIQGKNTGYWVQSKKNGNRIFLPAAGYFYEGGLSGKINDGYYWTGSLSTGGSSYAYGFYGSWDYYYRYYGLTVRPVCP